MISEVAANLENQGFTVTRQPRSSDLPRFLKDFQPDLVAVGKNRNIVVEVKRSSKPLPKRYYENLSSVLSNRPDWDFQLVVESTSPDLSRIDQTKPPTKNDIRKRLTEIERLVSEGETELAILFVSAVIEAILRRTLRWQDPKFDASQIGDVILKRAFAIGLLTKDDFEFFQSVAGLRNQVAHGAFGRRIDKRTLVSATKRASKLLEEFDN